MMIYFLATTTRTHCMFVVQLFGIASYKIFLIFTRLCLLHLLQLCKQNPNEHKKHTNIQMPTMTREKKLSVSYFKFPTCNLDNRFQTVVKITNEFFCELDYTSYLILLLLCIVPRFKSGPQTNLLFSQSDP